MKNKFVLVMLILLLTAVLSLTLTSCSTPNTSTESAADNAKPNNEAQDVPVAQEAESGSLAKANILVYENVYSASDAYQRPLEMRVDTALNNLNLTSDSVVRVQENTTEFLSQLRSSTEWDLIIVASESRDSVLGGEVWSAIYDDVTESKAALIVEMWYLDQIQVGRIEPLMNTCGFQLQRNLVRNEDSAIADYIIYRIDEKHPVFSLTEEVSGMIVPVGDYAWVGDVGDLLKVSGNDAKILGGLQPEIDDSYGTIVECMNGRVIFQTHSTHDYNRTDSTILWENYILYTLQNRFHTQSQTIN